MTSPRSHIVLEGEEAIYSCASRCVRRAYLRGFDKLTGKNFEHRKEWVKERLRFLVKIFTIEVLSYAIMCTHDHLLLLVLADLLKSLTDREIARRWLLLYPKRSNPDGSPCEPKEKEIKALTCHPNRIKELRRRLGSISWFMKSINEYIAIRANEEDDCKGRFWEGRFKCKRLESESAVLACSLYIDLNPVRAKIAQTPEESVYTSAYERIQSLVAKNKLIEQKARQLGKSKTTVRLEEISKMDSWLCPVYSDGARKGFLSIELPEYLSLLDTVGREIRSDKRGHIPDELKPILERLGINSKNFSTSIEHFGRRFYSVVGPPDQMEKAAKKAGQKWFKGIAAARKLFT